MILVDTSVWVDHFRKAERQLVTLLTDQAVFCHPFVIGELACGTLTHRAEILELLARLPRAPMADHPEALSLVESHQLMNSGIGWIDVHLLASARLAGARLWTKDRGLARAAARLNISI